MTKVKYTKELLEQTVKDCISFAELIRKLGLKMSGGNYCHIKSRLKKYEIDTSHFLGQGWSKGRVSNNRKTHEHVLVKNRLNGRREHAHRLRRSLIEFGREYKCKLCGNDGKWNNKKLVLPVDHIDGDFTNNEPENLRFLCPNCHSQTDNYGSKKRD